MVLGMSGSAQTSILGDAKDWNASASLQGFYDSNYNIGATKKGSYGIQLSPTVTATIPLTQTQIGFLYTYGLQWYQQRQQDNVNPYDQQHTVNLWVDHAFDERWDLKVSDVFNSGQEPELLSGGGANVAPVQYRLNGNNIANNATVTLNTEWTRLFSTSLVYANNFYQYSDQSAYAPSLNRIDNAPELDLQWHLTPDSILFVGYQFEIENYTDGSLLAPNPSDPSEVYVYQGKTFQYFSNSRDNVNHYGYVGIQQNLLPNLVASARAGFQYYETIDDPLGNTSTTSPYADVSLIYTYSPGSNAQIGFTQSRNSTDVISVNQQNYSITQDQESSSLYAAINHQITPKLQASVIGRWTDSQFNGGSFNNQSQTDYSLGVSANYAFTRHISGQAGYNYDDVTAPAGSGQAYVRNRVYVGFAVAY